MEKDYGLVLDERTNEVRSTRPGQVKVGDLLVRFDGWFVRGDLVTAVTRLSAGAGRTQYDIRLASWRHGGAHVVRVHASSKVEVLPAPVPALAS